MTTRQRGFAVTALCVAAIAFTVACSAPESGPPDDTGTSNEAATEIVAQSVLLITVDTLRADAVGFAGNEEVETPALDRLAAAGRVYPHAHAHAVLTLPSHASILTGLLPFEHGVRANSGFVLPTELPTLATRFSDAGFATAAAVGAFPLDARFGLDRGFDLYDDDYPEGSTSTEFVLAERPGDEVVAVARRWWRERAGERRFLWVHLFDPHAPYAPPEPYASRFASDPYLGEIATVDDALAPLIDSALAGDDTLVAFTSDHGEALGDHGELTHGLFAYESTLRVPLVLAGAGIDAGEDPRAARHIDLAPTLMSAAEVAPPDDLPGRSLLAPPAADPPITYFESLDAFLNRGWAPLVGIIEEGEKYIRLPLPELYDLADDPAEQRNLIDDRRRRARELEAAVPDAALGDPEYIDRSVTGDEEAARLRSLGYVAVRAEPKDRYTADDDPKNLVELDRKLHRVIDLYQRRRLVAATELAREVVDARPDMGVASYHLSQVLLERGMHEEALEVLVRADERGAATGAARRQLGLLLARAGKASEALEVLEPMAGDGAPETLNALGIAYIEAGRIDRATATLHRIFERDEDNPEAHQNLALAELNRQRWTEAVEHAEAALAHNDRLPMAWNYLGVARYNLGRADAAVAAWERAVELAPSDFDLVYNLGLVAAEVGDAGRARRALERFVAEAPPERYERDIAKARSVLRRLGSG